MLKNLIFGIKVYIALFKITPFYNRIKKYKKEGNVELQLKEMQKVNNYWGTMITDYAKINIITEGLEKLPTVPALYVSNHQSNFDIPSIAGALPRQFGFIAKSSLAKVPILSHWITAVGGIFIDRDDPRQSLRAIQEGIEKINNGFSIIIFPEGTRSHKQEMADFKKGSMRLAVKSKAPIVPITIIDSYKHFEETGVVTGGDTRIIIHDPIDTSTASKEELKHINETVENIIREGLNM